MIYSVYIRTRSSYRHLCEIPGSRLVLVEVFQVNGVTNVWMSACLEYCCFPANHTSDCVSCITNVGLMPPVFQYPVCHLLRCLFGSQLLILVFFNPLLFEWSFFLVVMLIVQQATACNVWWLLILLNRLFSVVCMWTVRNASRMLLFMCHRLTLSVQFVHGVIDIIWCFALPVVCQSIDDSMCMQRN